MSRARKRPNESDPVFLTVHEVSRRLGINRGTVYAWIAKRILTGRRIDGVWRIPAESITADSVPKARENRANINPVTKARDGQR